MRWPDESSRAEAPDARGSAGSERGVEWARAALELGLHAPSAPAAALRPSTRVGDFELLEVLGRGATATVYRARQLSLNRIVALKLMLKADLASAADIQRFRFGAEAAAELVHPNIAPIYQVGSYEGVPFLTMRLFEGGTLAQALPRLRRSHVTSVALMAKVAHAVHYAHERGVLHRDLKSANIVLDEHDEPFVVDFGFAKHLDERATTSKPSVVAGTMGYMAPEQTGGARSLTFASDIYALGAILYELLTGEVPFQGLALAELVEKLTSADPVPSPRRIDASIDRELALVCLKCLEKDPGSRYRSAAELARDLERWLRGDPIALRSDRGLARVWRWCRAHPALTTLLAGAACVLTATAKVALSVAHEQEQILLSEVLHANVYAAQAKAGQVLFQLRELSYPIARCASDARIAELLALTADPNTQPSYADRLLVECGAKSVFDSVAVVSREGIERARLPRRLLAPVPEDVITRDYFRGAMRLAEGGYRSVHVGRVLRSEEDGERYASLAAPVFDADNHWLGVVSVTVSIGALLEALELSDSGRQIAVLAGVREREPGDPRDLPTEGVMVLLHGRLGDTEGTSSWLKELTRLKSQAAGRDPFRFSARNRSLEEDPRAYPVSAFGNRWLAGFAPVGHTGYAVVVQTRYEAALEGPQRALLQLVGWSGAIFVLGASAVFALAWTLRKRAAAQRG